jgi:hypothetical protein
MKDLTVKLSGESYSTLSIILPAIHQMLNHHLLKKDDDSKLISDCKDAMSTDIKKRYQNDDIRHVLISAAFCDPRFKNLVFASAEEKKECHDDIVSEIEKMIAQVPETEINEPEAKRVKREPNEGEFTFDSLIDANISDEKTTPKEKAEDQLKRYIADTVEPSSLRASDFSVLSWWQKNEARYPEMAKLAKKYLCTPATSTPSERVFSLAENIVTKKRSMLRGDNVDKLIFLNKNLE